MTDFNPFSPETSKPIERPVCLTAEDGRCNLRLSSQRETFLLAVELLKGDRRILAPLEALREARKMLTVSKRYFGALWDWDVHCPDCGDYLGIRSDDDLEWKCPGCDAEFPVAPEKTET